MQVSELSEEHLNGSAREIGARLRDVRIGRRMTLKTLAEKAGLSESFLSQIERGRNMPSLRTLFKIAGVHGLTPVDLLDDSTTEVPALITKERRAVLDIGPLKKFSLLPRAVTTMEVLGATIEPGGSAGEPYTHGDSDEVLLVVTGTVNAEVDGKAYVMNAGDALYYRSSMPHTVQNRTAIEAEVLWIVCPPS